MDFMFHQDRGERDITDKCPDCMGILRDDIAEAVEKNTTIAVHKLHSYLAPHNGVKLIRSISAATGISMLALQTWGFVDITHVLIDLEYM